MQMVLKMYGLMVFFVLCGPFSLAFCDEPSTKQKAAYLEKVAVESSNPVGELWLITNQFEMNLQRALKNPHFKDPKPQFSYNFQPVLKFDLGDDWRFITRPVVALYDSPSPAPVRSRATAPALPGSGASSNPSHSPSSTPPTPRSRYEVDYTFGLGDTELKGVLSPQSKGNGFKWGIGPSIVFPTATNERLGSGKWQLGGALAAIYVHNDFIAGLFPEHWWSVAGDRSRADVSLTKIDYFLWYSPIPTWQIGMSPTVRIDWLQQKADDALTLPVGLGASKTLLFGKMPIKFIAEADYAVIGPRRTPGDEWSFKFSIVPIIPALF